MDDWISVKDRLPEDARAVLVCDAEEGRSCKGQWFTAGCAEWSWNDERVKNITHWLPIPDLPKAEPRLPFHYGYSETFERWRVYHRATGCVCGFSSESEAQKVCDRLNKIQRTEPEDQLPEPSEPESGPSLPFCVIQRDALMPSSIVGLWGLYHIEKGWICDVCDGKEAERIRDRLNKLWQLEREDRLSESKIPRCPQCDVALSLIVVNKPTTSHTYWECPRCGKEEHPIKEAVTWSQCKDCGWWLHDDGEPIRYCCYLGIMTEATEGCYGFRKKRSDQ